MAAQSKFLFSLDAAPASSPEEVRVGAIIDVGSSSRLGVICMPLPQAKDDCKSDRLEVFDVRVPVAPRVLEAVAKGLDPSRLDVWNLALCMAILTIARRIVPFAAYKVSATIWVRTSSGGRIPAARCGGLYVQLTYWPLPTDKVPAKILVEISRTDANSTRYDKEGGYALAFAPSAILHPAPRLQPMSVRIEDRPNIGVVVLGTLDLRVDDVQERSECSLYGDVDHFDVDGNVYLWAVATMPAPIKDGILDLRHHDGESDSDFIDKALGWVREQCLAELSRSPSAGDLQFHTVMKFSFDRTARVRFAMVAVPCRTYRGRRPVTIVDANTGAWPLDAYLVPHSLHESAIRQLVKAEQEAALADSKLRETAAVPSAPPTMRHLREDGTLLDRLIASDGSAPLPPLNAIAKHIAGRSEDLRVVAAAAARGVRFSGRQLSVAARRGVGADFLDAMCAASSVEEIRSAAMANDAPEALRSAAERRGVVTEHRRPVGASPAEAAEAVHDQHAVPLTTPSPQDRLREMAEKAQQSRQARKEEIERHRAAREAQREAERAERENATGARQRNGNGRARRPQ